MDFDTVLILLGSQDPGHKLGRDTVHVQIRHIVNVSNFLDGDLMILMHNAFNFLDIFKGLCFCRVALTSRHPPVISCPS